MGLTASLPRAKPTLPGCSARCIPITAQRLVPVHPCNAVPCTAGCARSRTAPGPAGSAQRSQSAVVCGGAAGFDIQWLWPAPQDAGALCSCPVSAAKLTGALQGLAQQGKRPFGVYITSPDYLGGVQDIAALAEVCKDFGVPLLVDNAHGAYLRFLPQGGQHPIALGAAMCCDSGHKTLPVVTGGAYLHLAKMPPFRTKPLCAMHWHCLVPPVRLT